MRPLRLIPDHTRYNFVGFRYIAYVISAVLILGSLGLFLTKGLNLGIDFQGGTIIEIRTPQAADLTLLRQKLAPLNIGEASIQEFGSSQDLLIRLQKQKGNEQEQFQVIEKVKSALGPDVEYRRIEFVGPQVGDELKKAGLLAVILSVIGIGLYVWIRFEWQYGIGALMSLAHDVVGMVGLYALMQFEFNLSTVAAVLTIAGYSINDTVVVYDRIRENLTKYKKTPLADVLNLSVNETLSRTTMTSLTTVLALVALYFFGGEAIRSFSLALIWGILIGTYSSIFVAAPFLLWTRLRPQLPEMEKTLS